MTAVTAPRPRTILALACCAAFVASLFSMRSAVAAIGLTTVPARDLVRLTIYNGVDLTLAQEYRTLVLRKGVNRIQYQWAGTLIDSTSLELRALTHAKEVEVADVVYPKGAPATLVWEVRSEFEGPVRFEISGFTSGLSWAADYVLRANTQETAADVEGFVSIQNASGEDYTGAEVRLVVGTVHLVESIRDLATNQLFQRRTVAKREDVMAARAIMESRAAAPTAAMDEEMFAVADLAKMKAPVVESRRFGDYHLFTISGTHGLATGATTRLRAIATEEAMPLEVLYRVPFRQNSANKVYRFVNDDEHKLPAGPLPEGAWHVFRQGEAANQPLSYSGLASHAYVPPKQKVELQLGVDPAIAVRQTYEWRRETHHHLNTDQRVDGWYAHDAHLFKLVNTKAIPVSVEYMVTTPGGEWRITGLEGERRDATTYRVQERVPAGQPLELGPFVITSRVGNVDSRSEFPPPPDPHKFARVSIRP